MKTEVTSSSCCALLPHHVPHSLQYNGRLMTICRSMSSHCWRTISTERPPCEQTLPCSRQARWLLQYLSPLCSSLPHWLNT